MALLGRKRGGVSAEERDMGRKLRAGLAREDRWALEEMRRHPEDPAKLERIEKAAQATVRAMEAANAAANDMGLSAAKNRRAAELLEEAAALSPEEPSPSFMDTAPSLREQAAHFRRMKGY